jgi:hypothetical protein
MRNGIAPTKKRSERFRQQLRVDKYIFFLIMMWSHNRCRVEPVAQQPLSGATVPYQYLLLSSLVVVFYSFLTTATT